MPDVDVKTCFKCEVCQPLSEFYRHKGMADGHLNKCKACTKRDALVHRHENVEKIRAHDRDRSKLPHRVSLGYENAKAYRKKYPERYRANSMVAFALKQGALSKQPCMHCGSTEVEAHHPDYSRPLDVVWLCPPAHKEIHLAYPDDHYHDVHNPKPTPAWRNE